MKRQASFHEKKRKKVGNNVLRGVKVDIREYQSDADGGVTPHRSFAKEVHVLCQISTRTYPDKYRYFSMEVHVLIRRSTRSFFSPLREPYIYKCANKGKNPMPCGTT